MDFHLFLLYYIFGDTMELEDQFKYLVGGYYGVSLIDEYILKEYTLEDIKKYIENFIEINPINDFDYREEAIKLRKELSTKVMLQDALIVVNKIKGPIDLVFLIKNRLKKYDKK